MKNCFPWDSRASCHALGCLDSARANGCSLQRDGGLLGGATIHRGDEKASYVVLACSEWVVLLNNSTTMLTSINWNSIHVNVRSISRIADGSYFEEARTNVSAGCRSEILDKMKTNPRPYVSSPSHCLGVLCVVCVRMVVTSKNNALVKPSQLQWIARDAVITRCFRARRSCLVDSSYRP